ncbi:hypothetical protein D3C83_11520 [compost metagenome]
MYTFALRLRGKEVGIVRADHPGAGTRRRDDVIAGLELRENFPRQRKRRPAIARVIAGLAATGLACRNHHLAPGRLQQAQRREPDAGTHEIDEAGNEKAYAHAAGYPRE